MNSKYINIVAASLICILSNAACSGKSSKEKIVGNYTVVPKEDIVLYGFDLQKIMNLKFSDIEKTLGCKAKVDSEVAVVFIDTKRDFIEKQYKTDVVDNIDITYGPIEDTLIYKNYLNVLPRAAILYGTIDFKESVNNKRSISRELQNILPSDQHTKQIVDKIDDIFMTGTYKEGVVLVVNFKLSDYPIAKFATGYLHNRLFYKYTFSKDRVIYP